MTRWSIRARLSAWFAAVLALVLIVLAGAVWWAITDSVGDTIDQGLTDRTAAVAHFLGQPGTSREIEELRDDLREYVALDPGWNLLRIRDAAGVQIYRSEAFDPSVVSSAAAPAHDGDRRFTDAVMRGRAVRLLSARVTAGGGAMLIDVAIPIGELQEVLDEFRVVLLIVLPVGILAAALGGYWMAGRALGPVDRLTAAARSISADRLDARLDVPPTGDELQRLAETLNEMLDRLGGSFDDIRRFTADASHELRTPVSVMRTTAEVALRSPQSSDEYRAALQNVVAESERASALVEGLLMLARADAGTGPEAVEPADVDAVIAAEQPRLAARAADRGLRLRVVRPGVQAMTRIDSTAIARLLWILADNALKYTPAPGEVTVSVTPDGAGTTLTVADTGIGIAAADLPHVFDRFYRADPARSRDSGGAGLGLAIARAIVDRNGGRIAIQSDAGSGCTVRVNLPG